MEIVGDFLVVLFVSRTGFWVRNYCGFPIFGVEGNRIFLVEGVLSGSGMVL